MVSLGFRQVYYERSQHVENNGLLYLFPLAKEMKKAYSAGFLAPSASGAV